MNSKIDCCAAHFQAPPFGIPNPNAFPKPFYRLVEVAVKRNRGSVAPSTAAEFDHGKDVVEHFLDAALSIQEHVDYNLLLHDNEPTKPEEKTKEPTSEYDDLWGLEKRAQKAEEERDKLPGKPPKFPEKPEKDILLFLNRYSPHLEEWQRDVIGDICHGGSDF